MRKLLFLVSILVLPIFSFPDKPSGLKNFGVSCYFNSTLQCFYNCSEVSEMIAKAYQIPDWKSNTIADGYAQFVEKYNTGTIAESFLKSFYDTVWPKISRLSHSEGVKCGMEDATEFLQPLLEQLDTAMPDNKGAVFNMLIPKTSSLFQVIGTDDLRLGAIGDPYSLKLYTVSQEGVKYKSLLECFSNYFAQENVYFDFYRDDFSQSYKIRNTEFACTKSICLLNSPRYLLVTLRRFNDSKEKLGHSIDMSPYLLIKKNLFCPSITGSRDACYELIGIIMHSGSLDGGHYTTLVKWQYGEKNKNKWFFCDDSSISQPFDYLPKKTGSFEYEKNGYVLLYKKIKKCPKEDVDIILRPGQLEKDMTSLASNLDTLARAIAG